MTSPVIAQAVEKYRQCAKDDRMSGETGRLGALAGEMDDAIADMLEYVNSITLDLVRQMPESVAMTVLGHAVSVAEAYINQDREEGD